MTSVLNNSLTACGWWLLKLHTGEDLLHYSRAFSLCCLSSVILHVKSSSIGHLRLLAYRLNSRNLSDSAWTSYLLLQPEKNSFQAVGPGSPGLYSVFSYNFALGWWGLPSSARSCPGGCVVSGTMPRNIAWLSWAPGLYLVFLLQPFMLPSNPFFHFHITLYILSSALKTSYLSNFSVNLCKGQSDSSYWILTKSNGLFLINSFFIYCEFLLPFLYCSYILIQRICISVDFHKLHTLLQWAPRWKNKRSLALSSSHTADTPMRKLLSSLPSLHSELPCFSLLLPFFCFLCRLLRWFFIEEIHLPFNRLACNSLLYLPFIDKWPNTETCRPILQPALIHGSSQNGSRRNPGQ